MAEERGREIESLAEVALTTLSQNSEIVAQQYTEFLNEVHGRIDLVELPSSYGDARI